MTGDDKAEIEHLEMLRDSKFREITDMVAGHLGIDFEWGSGPEPTKDEQKAEQRAQMIIDQWGSNERHPARAEHALGETAPRVS
jgi:hypothetical protein